MLLYLPGGALGKMGAVKKPGTSVARSESADALGEQ